MEKILDILTTPLPSYAYNLIALGFVVLFAIRGYRRGLIKEAFGIASLLLCIPLAFPLGYLLKPLFARTEIPLFLLEHIAVTTGGLIAYLFLILLFYYIERYIGMHWKPEGKKLLALHVGGAIIGSIFAVLAVLIMIWFVLTMGALSQAAVAAAALRGEQNGGESPTAQSDLLLFPAKFVGAHRGALSESIIGSIANEANPVPKEVTIGINIAVEVVQDPAKMEKLAEDEHIKTVLESEPVQEVLHNAELKSMAKQGDFLGIMNHPALKNILDNPDVQQMLQEIDTEKLLQSLTDEK